MPPVESDWRDIRSRCFRLPIDPCGSARASWVGHDRFLELRHAEDLCTAGTPHCKPLQPWHSSAVHADARDTSGRTAGCRPRHALRWRHYCPAGAHRGLRAGSVVRHQRHACGLGSRRLRDVPAWKLWAYATARRHANLPGTGPYRCRVRGIRHWRMGRGGDTSASLISASRRVVAVAVSWGLRRVLVRSRSANASLRGTQREAPPS